MSRPTELRVSKDRRQLTVQFEDEACFVIPAEMLRVYSPSAEVRGHGADSRKTVYGKRDVEIVQIIPAGNYAVRIIFDDLHDTGIYSWTFLYELGRDLEAHIQEYETELEQKGLSRDPVTR
jgi:DUF971 family protein